MLDSQGVRASDPRSRDPEFTVRPWATEMSKHFNVKLFFRASSKHFFFPLPRTTLDWEAESSRELP